MNFLVTNIINNKNMFFTAEDIETGMRRKFQTEPTLQIHLKVYTMHAS